MEQTTPQNNNFESQVINEGDTVTLQVNGSEIRGKIVHKCIMYVVQPESNDDDEHEEECITVSDELAGWMVMEVVDVPSIELVVPHNQQQEQNAPTLQPVTNIVESTNKEFVEFYTMANMFGAKFVPFNTSVINQHHVGKEHTLIQCVHDLTYNGGDLLHIKSFNESDIYMEPSCVQLLLSEQSHQKLLAHMVTVIPKENRTAKYLKETGIFHLSATSDNQLFLCMCKNN